MKTIKNFLEENTFFFDYDNYFLHILDLIIEFPTALKNKIIVCLLKRTHIYATTLYEVTAHADQTEMDLYFEYRRKERKIKEKKLLDKQKNQ